MAADNRPFTFCVFSFNRGRFLSHCIESIERHAPGYPIKIYDDQSSDPQTAEVLSQIGQKHTVFTAPTQKESKHGGLAGGMQRALANSSDREILCYLQDDMQLVRDIDHADLTAVHEFFKADDNYAFLHPAFIKQARLKKFENAIHFNADSGVYERDEAGTAAGVSYSDVCILHTDRLRAVDWDFAARESGNEVRARASFGKMGFLRNPFAMWLPAVPAWRGKRKTVALRLAEKRAGVGFHPFKPLEGQSLEEFLARDVSILPVAEDWLQLDSGHLTTPWSYHPLQNQRLLGWLNSIELALKK